MIAPTVALALFGLVVLAAAVVLWPGRGLLARLRGRRRRTDAELAEDILKRLIHEPGSDTDGIAKWLGEPAERVGPALTRLVGDGLVLGAPEGWRLTPVGTTRAAQLVRAHRLWERYLADRTGVAEVEWHRQAERVEHQLSPAEVDRLAARMGRPVVDPHGDPIPDADGEMPSLDGWPLSHAELGVRVEILHLEDEPPEPYQRLVKLGLAPGDRIMPVGQDDRGLEIRWGGQSALLKPDEVAAVTVGAVSAAPAPVGVPLAGIVPGNAARVTGLSPALRGPQRRRLLDLGFLPGTVVEAELASAMGDPVGYRVRGALIALRREQAEAVLTEPVA